MLIGLSLSACVQDIATHKVEYADVLGIVAGTRFDTFEAFEEVLRQYAEHHWDKRYVDMCITVCRRLLADGKIYQPRLEGGIGPTGIRARHWVEVPQGGEKSS